MTPAIILAEYKRQEAEAGGLGVANPTAVADAVMAKLGVSRETLKDALARDRG